MKASHSNPVLLIDTLYSLLTEFSILRSKLQKAIQVTAVFLQGGKNAQSMVQVTISSNFLFPNDGSIALLRQLLGPRLVRAHQEADYFTVSYLEIFAPLTCGFGIIREIMTFFFAFHSLNVWRLITIDQIAASNLKVRDPAGVIVSNIMRGAILSIEQLNFVQECSPHALIMAESKQVFASSPDIDDLAAVISSEFLLNRETVSFSQTNIFEDDKPKKTKRNNQKPDDESMEIEYKEARLNSSQEDRKLQYVSSVIGGYTESLPKSYLILVVTINGYPITKHSKRFLGIYMSYITSVASLLEKIKISFEDHNDETIFPCFHLHKSETKSSLIFIVSLFFPDLAKSSLKVVEEGVVEKLRTFLTERKNSSYSELFFNDNQRKFSAFYKKEFEKMAEVTREIYTLLDSSEKKMFSDKLEGVGVDFSDEDFERNFIETLSNNYCSLFASN